MNKQILEEVIRDVVDLEYRSRVDSHRDSDNSITFSVPIDRKDDMIDSIVDKILSDKRLSKSVDVSEIMFQWVKFRSKALSYMLNNPDDCGIYPTTDFYNKIDSYLQNILSTVEPVEDKEPSIKDLIKSQEIIKHFNKMDTDSFITKYEIFKGDVCPDEWKKEFKFTGLNNVDFMCVWPTTHNPSKEGK